MINKILHLLPLDAITSQNGEPKTNSLKIAEAFGKLHKNVIQKIEALQCSAEFTELNFQPSEYRDNTGRNLPLYEITKDGFMFIVMGFTGKKAAAIKEAFIYKFNELSELVAKASSGIQSEKTTNTLQATRMRILIAMEHGQVVSTTLVPQNSIVFAPSEIHQVIKEPGYFSIEDYKRIIDVAAQKLVGFAESARKVKKLL